MNKKKQLPAFDQSHQADKKSSNKTRLTLYLRGVVVLALILQLTVSALVPIYQVAAETTTSTTSDSTVPVSDTGTHTNTDTLKTTTAQSDAATSEETVESTEVSQPKESDPERLIQEMMRAIAQFGDIKGTNISIAEKKITIELSAQLSQQADSIRTVITTLIPEGYSVDMTAKQATAELNFWTPQAGANTTQNTGIYGDAGLENYVYTNNPFLDKVASDPIPSMTQVLKKGIFGTAKWYIDTNGTLHIGSGAFATSSNTSPWQTMSAQIKNIVFDGEVTAASDSESLFDDLSNVISIKGLEKLDMSNVESTTRMFNNMTSLTELSGIGSWETSNITTMDRMFYNASSLTSLDVSNWHTDKVTNMSGMFYDNTSLTNLDVSHWNTSNVEDLSFMFSGTKSLTSLDVSNWDTSGAYNMQNMFQLTGLTHLDVSKWDTSNTMNMNGVFKNASSLVSLNLSNWDTSFVSNMYQMLSGVSALKQITFGSGFVTPQVTSDPVGQIDLPNDTATMQWRAIAGGTADSPLGTEYIGAYNSAVNPVDTYVLVPVTADAKIQYIDGSTNTMIAADSVSGAPASTVNYAILDPWKSDLLKNLPYVFAGDGMAAFAHTPDPLSIKLTVDTLDNQTIPMKKIKIVGTTPAKGIFGNVKWYVDVDGMLHLGSGTLADAPDTNNDSKPRSPWNAFKDIITGITIDGPVATTAIASNLFASLENVKTITGLSNLDVSKAEKMNGMFSNMDNLDSIDLSSWNTSNATDMSFMFSDSPSLNSIDLTGLETGNVTTMENMFYQGKDLPSKLTSLDLSSFDTAKVTNMSGMFASIPGIETLDISHFDTSNVTTMETMFALMTGLKKLDLGKLETENVTDMMSMFAMDKSFEQLTLDVTDTSKVTASGMQLMFEGMTGLKEITFSKGFVTDDPSTGGLDTVELPNDTDTVKWRNVASGTVDDPAGRYLCFVQR
ncbi:BspA family leucine-rich repeat surface protein [Enterococcus sp. ZJ1668]|uniref:BspA family leucine-rich repeat surface protein n=1 Tax=Enterococcus sp. ZJ1668 TaxID=2709402 RepID=UPI0013EA0C00|nr:BspA family leucine-rich repeat surface protein [Enterococcus sp. ZJ1668]